MVEHTINLLKAQLAFKTQNAVIKNVTVGLVDPDMHIVDIGDMEKAIRGKPAEYEDVFKTAENRRSAESRWEQLKSKLAWKGKHTRYIRHLIEKYYVPLTDEFKLDLKVLEELFDNNTFKLQDGEPFPELLNFYRALGETA